MLTWSDWHTEPRSNRYHYATRFARHLPVYFVQPDGEEASLRFEPAAEANITLVHVPGIYNEANAKLLDVALRTRGVFRPLQWIYNTFFDDYIQISKPRLRVYHATEDYVTPSNGLRAARPEVIAPTCRVLERVDLLIAVSDGVAAAYRKHAAYGGPSLTLPNGCDYGFWNAAGACNHVAPDNGARVVLFQGGINARLDYQLLIGLVDRLPDWEFWFCGWDHEAPREWRALSARSNVRYFGRLSVEAMATLAKQALVGIIPFKQDPWIERSLPLKAYEYIACGLPVVSVPIDALRDRGELFAIETTAEGFAAAIERLATTRNEPQALTARDKAAREQSYDRRFSEAVAGIGDMIHRSPPSASSLNILMLYDDGSTIVRTVYEHLQCFRKYSRHNYHFMSATYEDESGAASDLDFGCFDAVVIHYSVRVSVPQHIIGAVAEAVARYSGPKLLFVQDEYENTETARLWIERLGITTVYTNIPLPQVALIYPRERFPRVDFVQTLTGYVPDDPELDSYAMPLPRRQIHLGYRGRQLPHHYGVLGYEKFRIGRDMRKLCAEFGVPADIEVELSKRIPGTDWYRFVGSCRAILGTESGSNVFDFDGSLKALSKLHADLSFQEFSDRFLDDTSTLVDMAQVSPKVFEAIRLRTALVLFEGAYSGVVEPDTHYIPLKKDYSNIRDVFRAISDLDYLGDLTDRAYRDIIEGQRYSYRTFVESCDQYLDARVGRNARAAIVSVPVVALTGSAQARLWPVSIQNPVLVTSTVVERPSALDETNAVVLAALNLGRGETEYARSASGAAYEGAGKARWPLLLQCEHSQETIARCEISLAGLVPEREAAKIARENELYRREITRLNEVYSTEIARLNKAYSAEIARLSDPSGESSGQSIEAETDWSEIARLHEVYTGEIAKLNAEIVRLNEARAGMFAQSNQISDFQLVAIPIAKRSAAIRAIRAGWRRLPLGIRGHIVASLKTQLHAAQTTSPDSIRGRWARLLARAVPATVRRLLRAL